MYHTSQCRRTFFFSKFFARGIIIFFKFFGNCGSYNRRLIQGENFRFRYSVSMLQDSQRALFGQNETTDYLSSPLCHCERCLKLCCFFLGNGRDATTLKLGFESFCEQERQEGTDRTRKIRFMIQGMSRIWNRCRKINKQQAFL